MQAFQFVLHGLCQSLPETRQLRWQTIGSLWLPVLAGFGNFPLATRLQVVGLATLMMRAASFTSVIARSAFRPVLGMPVSCSEAPVSRTDQPFGGVPATNAGCMPQARSKRQRRTGLKPTCVMDNRSFTSGTLRWEPCDEGRKGPSQRRGESPGFHPCPQPLVTRAAGPGKDSRQRLEPDGNARIQERRSTLHSRLAPSGTVTLSVPQCTWLWPGVPNLGRTRLNSAGPFPRVFKAMILG